LQEELYNEIIGRIKQTDESVPYFDNGYFYYTRYEEGGEFPVYCRKKGSLDSEEEILLNVNEMAEGYSYYHISGMNVSPDNRILAFGVDSVGRYQYSLRFKDLETGSFCLMRYLPQMDMSPGQMTVRLFFTLHRMK
jgi:oligopeptidase B